MISGHYFVMKLDNDQPQLSCDSIQPVAPTLTPSLGVWHTHTSPPATLTPREAIASQVGAGGLHDLSERGSRVGCGSRGAAVEQEPCSFTGLSCHPDLCGDGHPTGLWMQT